MEYYTKPFNYNNTLGLPNVTREYLASIGVEETSIGYYEEPENEKYDIPIEFHPIETILLQNYDCVVPVWGKSDSGGYLLVRKGKECMIIYRDGGRCANIMESFITIIPPTNSHEFVVQRKDGKWGVVAPHKEKAIVDFGKYKYMWGFDSGLCLFEVETNNKQTFSNRGIISYNGTEVVKPYTYTNIHGFYGKGNSYIEVEREDKIILLAKDKLLNIENVVGCCNKKNTVNDYKGVGKQNPWFLDMGEFGFDNDSTQEQIPPPIIPSGTYFPLPLWGKLSQAAKDYLVEVWGIDNENEYNKLLHDDESIAIVEHDLKCRGII